MFMRLKSLILYLRVSHLTTCSASATEISTEAPISNSPRATGEVLGVTATEDTGSGTESDREADPEDESLMMESQLGNILKYRSDEVNFDLHIDRLLGSGSFGRVVLCSSLNEPNDDRVAVKLMRIGKSAESEVAIWRAITARRAAEPGSPEAARIVRVLGGFYPARVIYGLIFEPLGISLEELLKVNSYTGLYLEDVQKICTDLLLALKFCHRLNIVHADIKPANILLVQNHVRTVEPQRYRGRGVLENYLRPLQDADGVMIKLIDFGLSGSPSRRLVTTLPYRSPEALRGDRWTTATDMWSTGCVIVELVTGDRFIENMNEHDLRNMSRIRSACKSGLRKRLSAHSQELITFLKQFIQFQARNRITAANALKSEFLNSNITEPATLTPFDEEVVAKQNGQEVKRPEGAPLKRRRTMK